MQRVASCIGEAVKAEIQAPIAAMQKNAQATECTEMRRVRHKTHPFKPLIR